MTSGNRVWITWDHHRRSESLSAELRADYLVIGSRLSGILRYASCAARTLWRLVRDRPAVVFVQSPSIFLAAIATAWGRLTGVKVVVDAHNAGVLPLEGRSSVLLRVAGFAIRRATLVIVTTEAFASRVRDMGGRPFVLMDPLPGKILGAATKSEQPADGRTSIVCITTWAHDEPVEELLAAAPLLPANWRLSFTGRPPAHIRQRELPQNVHLTGFLSDSAYLDLLLDAACVVDLTTRDDCLVCGAYEAIAAGRSLVLSDTRALRDAFGEIAVFTRNDREAIAAAVKVAVARGDGLAGQSGDFASRFVATWQLRKGLLERDLELLPASRD